jgi:thiamine pyrophosphokinase
MRIYTDTQVLEYVKDREIIITGTSGQHCGIMAFPKARMSTRGLKYDTHIETTNDSFDLELGFSESISNELSQETATIKIQGEALIIYSHPYCHPATSSTADQNPD